LYLLYSVLSFLVLLVLSPYFLYQAFRQQLFLEIV